MQSLIDYKNISLSNDIKAYAKTIAKSFSKNYSQYEDLEILCLEAAWMAQEKVKIEVNPKNYYLKIMENTAKDYLRKEKKHKGLVSIELGYTLILADAYKEIDSKDCVDRILTKFSKIDRDLIEYLIEGYSIRDIAKATGSSVLATKTSISRRRKKWRKIYEKERNRQ